MKLIKVHFKGWIWKLSVDEKMSFFFLVTMKLKKKDFIQLKMLLNNSFCFRQLNLSIQDEPSWTGLTLQPFLDQSFGLNWFLVCFIFPIHLLIIIFILFIILIITLLCMLKSWDYITRSFPEHSWAIHSFIHFHWNNDPSVKWIKLWRWFACERQLKLIHLFLSFIFVISFLTSLIN